MIKVQINNLSFQRIIEWDFSASLDVIKLPDQRALVWLGLNIYTEDQFWRSTYFKIYMVMVLPYRLCGYIQNLLENWVSKQSFFVLILTTAWNFFFRNKTFLFFKIESWNFQVQFVIEFLETLQNFNSIGPLNITIVWMSWMSWNFKRFHEI